MPQPDVASPEPIEPHQLGIGTLFHRIRDAVIVGDANTGRIVLWNQTAERVFGYTRAEALRLLIEDLVPEDLRAQHRKGLAAYARHGRGRLIDSGALIELPGRRKDGSLVSLEFSLTPLESADFPGRYALAILRDTTERKRAEHELTDARDALEVALAAEKEASARLREVDELRSGFVAMVAHDVRSPMAAVSGFARLLIETGESMSLDQRRDALERIEAAADRVVRLSEDLLHGAALETGSVHISVEPIELRPLVEEVCAPARASDRHRFTIDVPDDIRVEADPERVWQIVTNLVTNAMRFASSIDIDARHDGHDVELVVSDDGPGVDPDDRDRIFGRFTRLGAQGHGFGLGLYLSRQLAELMNGSLSCDDRATKGATFVLRLPAAP